MYEILDEKHITQSKGSIITNKTKLLNELREVS